MNDFDGLGHGSDGAEHLAALRRQRMLLTGLRDDVGLAVHDLSSPGPTDAWVSAAQRAYLDCRAELCADLGHAWRCLDAALSELHAAIIRLAAEP